MKFHRGSLAIVIAVGGLVTSAGAFLLLSDRLGGTALNADGLEAARAKWERAGIADYDLHLTVNTTGSDEQAFVSTVRHGRVSDLLLNGKPSTSRQKDDYSVEGLFSTLARELELSSGEKNGFNSQSGGNLLRVTFDEKNGFVRRYLRSIGGTGRTTEIRIIRFEPHADSTQPCASAESRPKARCAAQVWRFIQEYGEETSAKLDDIMKVVHEAGYGGFQAMLTYVSTEASAKRFAELLDRHELEAAGFYAGGLTLDEKELDADVKRIVTQVRQAQKHIRFNTLTINPRSLPQGESKTDAQLELQAKGLRRLSAFLRGMNVKLLLHFHAPEMADNAREFHHLMSRLSPEELGVSFDVDWVLRGGQDVQTLLDQYADRVGETHLRSSRQGVWDERLREGDVDLSAVIRTLAEADFDGWHIVELSKEAGTPSTAGLAENLKLSREYLDHIAADLPQPTDS